MDPLRDAKTVLTVVRRGARRRLAARRWERYESERGPLASDHFEAVVYFADSKVNLYQIRQWYAPLMELAQLHPIAVIARSVVTAELLRDECPLPVIHLQRVSEIEEWLDTQRVGAVFYLNQNTRNFQMMRFREPAHVFLSHGESDKDYMASNQLKAYDYAFIAGTAARERVSGRLIDYDVSLRTKEIGRPQVDVRVEAPMTLPADGRTVVFYAPTWEGDRPSMTYSSVASHGGAMIDALVQTGQHRVIYRPHPRTGVFDPAFRHRHHEIVRTLEAANRADATAQHIVDLDSHFGWHMESADVCIADISAVAFDWIPTGKPIVLTRPANPEAEVSDTGIVASLIAVEAGQAADIVDLLIEADGPAQRASRLALAERYFGDITPGASMQRWRAAASETIAARMPHH